MNIGRLNKIKSLNNEVKEFHPVLNELFIRLPNITNVEYTHGTNEMGADFVLSKFDKTLSRTEYIGTVVKTGKIAQNHSDIDTQIEECEVERKIEGGKKKIYITEIWVVTNNTISNQAQTKIHHKYKNKKINFLQGEVVTELINKHYPEYWTDISIEIGNFLRSIVDKSSTISTNIEILDTSSYDDVFIKQELINLSERIHIDPGRTKPPKRHDVQSMLSKEKMIFVEGTMGTGKSKLLIKLVEEYSTSESFNTTKTIPYIITFKEYISDFDGNINNICDLIDSNIKLEGKNYLIMLDALDELSNDDQDKVNILEKIYQTLNSRQDCTVIVTSRPFDRPDTDTEIDKYFTRFELLPLTTKQIVSLVDTICNSMDITSRLLGELEKSHLFKVLPKTPISAIILAKLLSQNIQEIPSTMTELYSKYTELVLGRWDIDIGLQSQNEYDVQRNVILNIAKFLLDNELDKISINEARDMFDLYIISRKVKVNKSTLFDKMISNNEIFKLNNSNMTISFIHRTFTEYFYACHMDRDNTANINQDVYNLYWNNAFFFYFGLKKDCPELVEALEKIVFTEEEAMLSQMFSNGNFLLAAYLTPYEKIEKSIIKSFNDAAKLFTDVINDKISSSLVILPKIHVLSIFTHSMCSSYGYDFFIEALENRSMDISTIQNPSEEQYAELFLINSTLVSINKFLSFDTMVTNYGKKIPQVLQVGINHSVENKTASPVVKKYIKLHRKKVKNNKSLRESIHDLYDKPINEKAALEFKECFSL